MTPLALQMLVHFHFHTPDDVFPGHDSADGKLEIDRLLSDGIIERADPDDPHFTLTGRGMAWIEMILATPLPVQQWSDPRGGDIGKAAIVDDLLAGLKELARPPAYDWKQSAPPASDRVFAYLDKPAVPPDFTAWSGGTNPLVQPQGSKSPMHDVVVLYSSGKMSKKIPAQSVHWQHRGGDFDVIGYKAFPVNDAVPAS